MVDRTKRQRPFGRCRSWSHLDVNRGALEARFIGGAREVQVVHDGSRNPWYFKSSDLGFVFPEETVVVTGARGGGRGSGCASDPRDESFGP